MPPILKLLRVGKNNKINLKSVKLDKGQKLERYRVQIPLFEANGTILSLLVKFFHISQQGHFLQQTPILGIIGFALSNRILADALVFARC